MLYLRMLYLCIKKRYQRLRVKVCNGTYTKTLQVERVKISHSLVAFRSSNKGLECSEKLEKAIIFIDSF